MSKTIEKWDKAADGFQKTFESGGSDYSRRLMDFITGACGISAGSRVLDIGCGVGKYGVYLARLGVAVTLTDISPKMLEHARRNLAATGGSYRTLCGDWDAFDLGEPELAGGFDLSMATMSPAIHDLPSVRKMSAVTKGVCLVANFVSWNDHSAELYRAALGLTAQEDESLGAACDELCGFVREAGFVPRVRREPYCWADMRSPEESVRRFIERSLGGAADESRREILLERARAMANAEGLVCDSVNTEVAWVYWNTEERK